MEKKVLNQYVFNPNAIEEAGTIHMGDYVFYGEHPSAGDIYRVEWIEDKGYPDGVEMGLFNPGWANANHVRIKHVHDLYDPDVPCFKVPACYINKDYFKGGN